MLSRRLRGGLILQTVDGYRFVSAQIASSVVASHPVLCVPGLEPPALGLCVIDDKVVEVLSLGKLDDRHWVLCHIDGNWMGLAGARVLDSGLFEQQECDTNAVCWRGTEVQELDVRAVHLTAEQAIWKARAARVDSRHP